MFEKLNQALAALRQRYLASGAAGDRARTAFWVAAAVLVALLGVGLLTAAIAASTRTAQQKGRPLAAAAAPLKIAILAPLSGELAAFGVSTRNGALLAIEEWNARGGVRVAARAGGNRSPVEIKAVVEDSQCSPGPAAAAANKVIDKDKVRYIVGEVCSRASIPVSEIANSRGVVQISPSSTHPSVTVDASGNTRRFVFRACCTDTLQGSAGAKFARDRLGARSAFIMRDEANEYATRLAVSFEAAFSRSGGEIVGRESYTAGEADFSKILAKVAEARPDVVYLPDYYNIVNVVSRQARQRGVSARFLGGDGWHSADLDTGAARGSYFTSHYAADSPASDALRFKKAYGGRFTDAKGRPAVPDVLAAYAYDAANLLLQAIASAGVDDPQAVAAVLSRMSYSGPSGRMSGFDPQHNPVKSCLVLAVGESGVRYEATIDP